MNRVSEVLRRVAGLIDTDQVKLVDAIGTIGHRRHSLVEMGDQLYTVWNGMSRNAIYITVWLRPGAELNPPQKGTVPAYVDPKALSEFIFERLKEYDLAEGSWQRLPAGKRPAYKRVAEDIMRRLELEGQQLSYLGAEREEAEEPRGTADWPAPFEGDPGEEPAEAGPELRPSVDLGKFGSIWDPIGPSSTD